MREVTLLDALGAAGDLTIYGKRENVLLIRDNNGKEGICKIKSESEQYFFRLPTFTCIREM